jgi:hypothetical protein
MAFVTGIHKVQTEVKANNAFLKKSTTYYTLDSLEGSPYTSNSDGRTFEDHASIEFLERGRERVFGRVVRQEYGRQRTTDAT